MARLGELTNEHVEKHLREQDTKWVALGHNEQYRAMMIMEFLFLHRWTRVAPYKTSRVFIGRNVVFKNGEFV